MVKLLLPCTFVHMPYTVLEVSIRAGHDKWCMQVSALLAAQFTYPVAQTVNRVFCCAYLKLRDHRLDQARPVTLTSLCDSHQITS